MKPEELARQQIDAALVAAGWVVQDADAANLYAGRGVAVREFPMRKGFGFADYLLFVDRQAAGAVEAKKAGEPLTGVETQAEKYSVGLPDTVPAPLQPLPFLYQSTGVETRFTNGLDPEPRSRRVFAFHRPATLAAWAKECGDSPSGGLRRVAEPGTSYGGASLRGRVHYMPPLQAPDLWDVQRRAVFNLEESLKQDRPRALIQMATGSGKTYTAITAAYRLIKFGGAARVLFLVDRANLGRQALKEFQQYVTPDDGCKFTELYNVQLLSSNTIDPVARVCITTIQRLYSMLQGTELDPELEELSGFDPSAGLAKEPLPVVYNPDVPIETFDVIFTDECHRSIYNLWRQVLEYFDAYLVGLTATPSKQTLGFFNQNLVMEYSHEQAVIDLVNVDFEVYRIRTRIAESGSSVEAGMQLDFRDRQTRAVRWETLDEEFSYPPGAPDRDVVAMDQIRTVVRTFKEKLFTEIFPGRTDVPKTLIYAKDDSHADDIVQAVREEFGKGNDFAQKITYKSGTARIVTRSMLPSGEKVEEVVYKASGIKTDDLLSSFRNSYNPRIVVTVDMIATGTDIKPLEIVMFMRAVKSRNFFEQMKGRGVRVIGDTDFQAVTPDAKSKTHFVLVDCVGVTEQDFGDSQPLERKRTVSFEKLLDAVAFGNTTPDVLSSIAGRLARLDRRLGRPDREALAQAAGGLTLQQIAGGILAALDADLQVEAARAAAGLPESMEPDEAQLAAARAELLRTAALPLASNPTLRRAIVEAQQRFEQTIDTISKDDVLEAGYSAEARERAHGVVRSFEQFIEENRDEITALQVLYSRPAQLRPARQDAAEDQRPGGRGRAGQRLVRGRCRRDDPPQAAAGVRRAHPPAAANRNLLRTGRQS
jgi:type I restriction enzyme, R subunit